MASSRQVLRVKGYEFIFPFLLPSHLCFDLNTIIMFGEIITYETSNLEIFSVPLLLPASPPRIPRASFSNRYFIVSYIMARDFLTFIFTHNRRQNYIIYILIFCIVPRSLYTKQYSYNKFVVSILLCIRLQSP